MARAFIAHLLSDQRDNLFTVIPFQRMRLERFSSTCSPESVTANRLRHSDPQYQPCLHRRRSRRLSPDQHLPGLRRRESEVHDQRDFQPHPVPRNAPGDLQTVSLGSTGTVTPLILASPSFGVARVGPITNLATTLTNVGSTLLSVSSTTDQG